MAQMERELGIADGLLRRWRIDLQQAKDQGDAFPENGNIPDSEGRLRQLERENAQLMSIYTRKCSTRIHPHCASNLQQQCATFAAVIVANRGVC